MHKITTIGEHAICMDILPDDANILDAGCRGFDIDTFFYPEVQTKVTNIDIDLLPHGNPFIFGPQGEIKADFTASKGSADNIAYFRLGVSNFNGISGITYTEDLQGTCLGPLGTKEMVCVYTTEKLKQLLGIKWWDYIKLDVEGEEYQILDTNLHPMATQVSVEFHEHTHRAIGKENLDALLNHLSRWYYVYNQNWESRHGAGFNYWDILLIAKF